MPAAAKAPSPPWQPRLLIFDVFGTLVTPQLGYENTFADGLREYGIQPTVELMVTLQLRSERLAHVERSGSRKSYLNWTRSILDSLATMGITTEIEPYVIPALEQHHQAPMRPRENVVDTLVTLRGRGMSIAACSNWSWDLHDDLKRCGLLGLINFAITSASAGYRKPHPEIYRRVLSEGGVAAHEAVFIGDSMSSDVEGPMAIGIPAVHLVGGSQPSQARRRIGDIRLLSRLLLPVVR